MAQSSFSHEVVEKSDILKVVSSFIEVQHKGSSYVAVCPFHNDTNPSMNVNTNLNIYKCFACGAGGNAVSFVMRYLKVSWREACLKVAQICGIAVPESYSSARVEKLDGAQQALDDIQGFYRMMLRSAYGKKALDYLHGRNMDDETIERFGIGYAPSDPTLSIRILRDRKGHSAEELERAGIISSGSQELKDRYRERIMFPIRDARGHTVGFSGRKYLPDDPSDSKYINSPETPYFTKSRLLYNLDNAWEAARRDGYIYVVEGFMDAIAVSRAGISACVALMGTALTEENTAILKKLKVQVRLCLDSDDAGQNGERKIAPLLSKSMIPFRVVERFKPEEGKDADEVLKNLGADGLRKKLELLLDPVSFRLQTLGPISGNHLRQLDDIIAESAGEIAALSESEKEMVSQRISSRTGLNLAYVRSRIDRAGKSAITVPSSSSPSSRDYVIYQFNSPEERMTAPLVASRIMEERLAGRDLPEIRSGILVNESSILFLMCKSPAACDLMLSWIDQGNTDLLFPICSLFEAAIIDLYDQGEMSQQGLSDDQFNLIADDVAQQVEDDPESCYGLTGIDSTNYWEHARIYSKEFTPETFRSLLKLHEGKVRRMKMSEAAEREGDSAVMKRLQEEKARSLDHGKER